MLKPILWEIISELARVEQTVNDVINNGVVLLQLEKRLTAIAICLIKALVYECTTLGSNG